MRNILYIFCLDKDVRKNNPAYRTLRRMREIPFKNKVFLYVAFYKSRGSQASG
jgi:uncharacterized protein (DUF1919 family)